MQRTKKKIGNSFFRLNENLKAIISSSTQFILKTVFIGIFSSLIIPITMENYKAKVAHSEFYYGMRGKGAQVIVESYIKLQAAYYDICHRNPPNATGEMETAARIFKDACNTYSPYFPKSFGDVSGGVYFFFRGLAETLKPITVDRNRDKSVMYVDGCWEAELRSLFEIKDINEVFSNTFSFVKKNENNKYLPSIEGSVADSDNPYKVYYQLVLTLANPQRN